jgi:hypothetical protein
MIDRFGARKHPANKMKLISKTFVHNTAPWGIPSFIKRTELLDKKNAFIKHDKLKVLLEFEVELQAPVYSCESAIEDPTKRDLNMEDLLPVLSAEKFYDLNLVVGEEKLKVHKLVIVAKSRYFYEQLNDETKCFVIADFSLDVVKDVVDFLYGRGLKTLDLNCVELFEAAKKVSG